MSETLLRVDGLVKHFPVHMSLLDSLLRREVPMVKAVDGVSFTIKRGEIFGLVGESGCGKTTTGRAVIRLIEPTSGHVLFDGVDVDELPRGEVKAYRREMQIIFQDPFESLNPKMTIYELVAEPLEIHEIGSGDEERRALVSEALQDVQLIPPDEFLFRYPHELSGGMKKRVGLARAIAYSPEVMLYDEPSTGIDPIRADAINDLINVMKTELKVTSIVITHDMVSSYKVADRIAMLYEGRIIEVGTPRSIQASRNPVVQQFIRGEADGPIKIF